VLLIRVLIFAIQKIPDICTDQALLVERAQAEKEYSACGLPFLHCRYLYV
jgi:hypothetical protein